MRPLGARLCSDIAGHDDHSHSSASVSGLSSMASSPGGNRQGSRSKECRKYDTHTILLLACIHHIRHSLMHVCRRRFPFLPTYGLQDPIGVGSTQIAVIETSCFRSFCQQPAEDSPWCCAPGRHGSCVPLDHLSEAIRMRSSLRTRL